MAALSERTLARLRALVQQREGASTALVREAHEFQRDVVVAGAHALTGRVRAERVVRYYECTSRAADTAVEQLRLRCESLRARAAAARTALRRKAEVGDTLHVIDYLQLQIEHKQLGSRLAEQGTELARLKGSTSRAVKAHTALKARLAGQLRECARARTEAAARGAVLGRLEGEGEGVRAELSSLRAAAAALARAQDLRAEGGGGSAAAYDLPATGDYLALVALHKALMRELASWQRKVEIAELAARNAERTRSHSLAGSGADDAPPRPGWRPVRRGSADAAGAAPAPPLRLAAGFPRSSSPQQWGRKLPAWPAGMGPAALSQAAREGRGGPPPDGAAAPGGDSGLLMPSVLKLGRSLARQ